MKARKTVVFLCVLGMVAAANATLIHHWALDETSLTFDGSTWSGVQDSTSSTAGNLWGYASGDDLTQTGLGVLGNAGPLGGSDFAYDFAVDSGTSGVATNISTALPATGDFTLLAWIQTTNPQTSQGHVFSNNNAQTGRANLFVQNKKALFWAQGFTDGAISSTSDVDDGIWHLLGVARSSGTFYLSVDGEVQDSFDGPSVSIDQGTMWMIGRQRSYAGNYEGLVGDVQVYDEALADYVPEPATLAMLGLGGLCLRRRRHA